MAAVIFFSVYVVITIVLVRQGNRQIVIGGNMSSVLRPESYEK